MGDSSVNDAGSIRDRGASLTRRTLVQAIEHLWPRKVVIDGCLVPAGPQDPEWLLKLWLKKLAGDRRETERMINHVHVPDLILAMDDCSETTKDELRLLARAYVAFLEAEIRRVAPGRDFEIELVDDDEPIRVIEGPGGRRFRSVETVELQIICNLKH